MLMDAMDKFLLLLILGPIAAGILTPLVGKIHRVVRDIWSLGICAGALGLSIFLLSTVIIGKPSWAWWLPVMNVLPAPLLVIDRLGAFLATLFSFVFFLTTLYATGYLKGYPHQNEYYALVLVLLGAVTGIVFSAHLLVLYLFWELATLATWRLVGFYRSPDEIRIAEKTFLVTFFGSVLMLCGFAALYVKYQTFNIFDLSRLPVDGWVAVLILAGIFVKSATLPLHTWLADAHPAAPPPMSALLSGIIAKIGLVAYIRIFVQGLVPPAFWGGMVAGLAIASALVAAGSALVEKDYKRILAFSTVSQLGYIFVGFSLCSYWGIVGGLLYLASHCLAKAGLFLAFGIVERQTHERNVDELGGLVHTLPVTGVSTFILFLSIIGIPPLLGFFSKIMVIIAAAQKNIIVAAALVLVAIFTLVYCLRIFSKVFLGSPRGKTAVREPKLLTGVVVVLAACSIVFGLGIGYFIGFFNHFEVACSIF
jgi:formate hydrogenlyase subunit 3/multisubunit Na+/H+ antiporter MnhD subunit